MSRQADNRRRRVASDPSLRIGDKERNDAAEALSQHYSAGRLDDTELKERLDRAMSAKTGADLAGLTTDLPSLDPVAPQPPVPPGPRRHRNGLWVVLGVIFLLTAFAHGPFWWPWWMAFRIPWLIVAGVCFLLWRRSRRHRFSGGFPQSTD
jgi:Flp pilus assembly protein TadB